MRSCENCPLASELLLGSCGSERWLVLSSDESLQVMVGSADLVLEKRMSTPEKISNCSLQMRLVHSWAPAAVVQLAGYILPVSLLGLAHSAGTWAERKCRLIQSTTIFPREHNKIVIIKRTHADPFL